MNRARVRGVVAVVLSLVYPGLGHVYLRAWVRALAWFGLAVLTAVLVVPESTVTAIENNGFEALMSAGENLPLEALVPLLLVRALNVVDAYVTATRRTESRTTRSESDGQAEQCPECGKPLDDDLEFCPWCTTRLPEGGDGDSTTS